MADTLRRSFLMFFKVKKNLKGSTKYLQPALHGQLCQRHFSQNTIDFRYSDFTWHPRPVNGVFHQIISPISNPNLRIFFMNIYYESHYI